MRWRACSGTALAPLAGLRDARQGRRESGRGAPISGRDGDWGSAPALRLARRFGAAGPTYWQRNLDLVSAEPILAMHLDEERRRLAVFLGLGSNAGIVDFA